MPSALLLIDRVREISHGHTGFGGPPTPILHTEPVTGCMWCLDEARVQFEESLLRQVGALVYCHCGCDTPVPADRDVRTLIAVRDLA